MTQSIPDIALARMVSQIDATIANASRCRNDALAAGFLMCGLLDIARELQHVGIQLPQQTHQQLNHRGMLVSDRPVSE